MLELITLFRVSNPQLSSLLSHKGTDPETSFLHPKKSRRKNNVSSTHFGGQDSSASTAPLAGEVDRLARVAGRLLVGGDVGVELLLLGCDLCGVVLAVLGLVDRKVEDLELQLEDLVLDLADLEGVGVGTAGGGNRVVETARADLGVLGSRPGGLDDGCVGWVDVCEVVLVDLGGPSV